MTYCSHTVCVQTCSVCFTACSLKVLCMLFGFMKLVNLSILISVKHVDTQLL